MQTRLGAMRYKVSHLCIFSYDGTDRIRFAGQGYRAYSPRVGGFAMGFSIVSVCILVLALLLVAFRNRLIVRPLMSFLTRLFMND